MTTDNPFAIELHTNTGTPILVDECDSDLASRRWYQQKRAKSYVFTTTYEKGTGRKSSQFIHRIILSRLLGRALEKHEDVDHINGDTFDNRRANLRVATRQQNMQNSAVRRGSKSGYKGVNWNASCRKWVAMIRVDGKNQYLGSFTSREDAHHAYLEAATAQFGEFAVSPERATADVIPETDKVATPLWRSKLQRIADKQGVTLHELLSRALDELGSIKAMTTHFNVSYMTVYWACREVGVRSNGRGRRTNVREAQHVS